MECGGERPEEVLGRLLKDRGMTLALAESCTGGLISAGITDIAGSSDYYAGGVVAYDNRVKENVLGVPGPEISLYGAVSGEVARSMASGVRRLLATDIGLGVTGIAGPGGGSAEKPVGLVYIAVDSGGRTLTRELRLGGDRGSVRRQAVAAALEILLEIAMEIKLRCQNTEVRSQNKT